MCQHSDTISLERYESIEVQMEKMKGPFLNSCFEFNGITIMHNSVGGHLPNTFWAMNSAHLVRWKASCR